MANSSCVTEFLLLGFSSLGELQRVLFVVFLCLYLIILSGNLIIISVICLDHGLHTPMYFFLGVLSTSETFYTIVILPKMLINLLSVLRTLSFMSCVFQMYFFLGFAVTNCLLLGVMGVVFICLYLIILSGNLTIISVICLDHGLHTPMYFFLGVLSTSETFYTIVILPKMLINLLSVLRTLSFMSCVFQMYFFLGFAVTNCLLLGVMGYDRYAAICQPLHYAILMSWRVCGQLAVTCILGGFLISLLGTILVFSLPFCGSNKVNNYFCDISAVIRLACADTYINELIIFIGGVLVLVVPLIFICISYGFIVSTVLKISSAEGKRKAFSTCASHLIVVIVHYGCASSVYLRPSAQYTTGTDRLVTVTYTIITPLLNPMVYSLRNRDVQLAIRKMIRKTGFSVKSL
ncbi:olfactory receptor 10R2 [Camelus ferus]|nr:olfactory receptor 10R2 [Camelus ferus]